MSELEEVYEDIDAELSLAEFRDAVEEKIERMGGLADHETAAMLVAHELGETQAVSIEDLRPGMREARFLAKVKRVGELRTFEREDDDEDGHVINVEAADETGSVRLAFWDQQAQAIATEGLEPGTVLRVKGRPKEGYAGLEVSVHQAEADPDADIAVDLDAPETIGELALGQDGVHLKGRVLGVEPLRTFSREDGEDGQVANLMLGDESGRIRVTLWDEQAPFVESVHVDDCVELRDGYIRDRDDRLECHLGDRGTISLIDEDIEFRPETTPIESLSVGDVVDIAGVVRSTDDIRTFERDDGSTGQVRNVRVQDETGDMRVAIWGEKAETSLAPGDTVWLGEVEIREGWQDDLEASVGWQSTIAPVELSTVSQRPATEGETDGDGSASLDSFETDAPAETEEEPIVFTGTVVQTGSPVLVDDGDQALSVDTDADPTLGERVTVEGTRRGDRIDADSVTPGDGNP